MGRTPVFQNARECTVRQSFAINVDINKKILFKSFFFKFLPKFEPAVVLLTSLFQKYSNSTITVVDLQHEKQVCTVNTKNRCFTQKYNYCIIVSDPLVTRFEER